MAIMNNCGIGKNIVHNFSTTIYIPLKDVSINYILTDITFFGRSGGTLFAEIVGICGGGGGGRLAFLRITFDGILDGVGEGEEDGGF